MQGIVTVLLIVLVCGYLQAMTWRTTLRCKLALNASARQDDRQCTIAPDRRRPAPAWHLWIRQGGLQQTWGVTWPGAVIPEPVLGASACARRRPMRDSAFLSPSRVPASLAASLLAAGAGAGALLAVRLVEALSVDA